MEPLVCHDCTNPILVLKHLLNGVEYKMKNNEDRGECSAEVDNSLSSICVILHTIRKPSSVTHLVFPNIINFT